MIRLFGAILLAAILIACTSFDCGWTVELNEDDEAHLLYECRF